MQTVVSLINLAGRRLGLDPGAADERDLEQARDAIDGARALMPVLERREAAAALAPLRDALSALQLHYARLAGPPRARRTAPGGGGEPAPAPAAAPRPRTVSRTPPGRARRSAAGACGCPAPERRRARACASRPRRPRAAR